MLNKKRLKKLAPCKRRWQIYERFVDAVIAGIYQSEVNNTFAQRALDDVQLVRPLIERLDQLTASAVTRDLVQLHAYFDKNYRKWRPPKTVAEINAERGEYEALANDRKRPDPREQYKRYFKWLIEPKLTLEDGSERPGVDVFLAHHKTTRHYLDRVSSWFARSVGTAIDRFAEDRNRIAPVFFGQGARIVALDKIIHSGSDTHKGGQSVLIFELKVTGSDASGRGPHRLVYKPSDIEMDYRLCGNTEVFTPYPKQLRMQSLAELINTLRAEPPAAGKVPELPTYKIVPCNPGSLLEIEGDQFPIEESYGYIEFLSHLPEAGEDGLPRGRVRDSAFTAADWLTDDQQTSRFYQVWGAWLALARVFSWTDLHAENVIAHRKLPVPIDLEVSFSGRVTRIKDTQAISDKAGQVLDRPEAVADIAGEQEFGGLSGWRVKEVHPEVLKDQTSRMSISAPDAHRYVNKINRIAEKTKRGWQRVNHRKHVDSIGTGLLATLRLLVRHKEQVRIWTNAMGRCIGRAIPNATGNYQVALSIMTSPAHTHRDPDGDKPAWLCALDHVARNAALRHAAHDYFDLSQYDIPSYYHRLDSTALFNARGAMVSPTYFPRPNIEVVLDELDAVTNESSSTYQRDAVLEIAGGNLLSHVLQQPSQ